MLRVCCLVERDFGFGTRFYDQIAAGIRKDAFTGARCQLLLNVCLDRATYWPAAAPAKDASVVGSNLVEPDIVMNVVLRDDIVKECGSVGEIVLVGR